MAESRNHRNINFYINLLGCVIGGDRGENNQTVMSKSKHTPGPWKVKHSESKNAYNIIGTLLGSKYKIARLPYFSYDLLPKYSSGNKIEAEADAKLIAASPRMMDYIIKKASEGCKEADLILKDIL